MWLLAEDTIGPDDMAALADWLLTGPRLTQGEQVLAFEAAWSEWLGCEHAVMVGSGTTANFALMAVAGRRVPHRPRVGVSAVTWSTNVSPSLLLGHEVVVFDVDRATLGIDESEVCPAMDRGELDILFVTHLLGLCALTPDIVAAAERNGVVLLEDCCESHGARYRQTKVGTVGLGSTFSFYFGHHMSTIEGGMVSTDDADLADELRLMRAHGLARESTRFAEYAARSPDIDERFLFVSPGLNFRSTELNAFLGLRQLALLDERIEMRNANARAFLEAAPATIWREYNLAGMSSFALPLVATEQSGAPAIKAAVAGLDIESRPVVAGNLTRQPFLEGYDVTVGERGTPIADWVHSNGIYVGNGHHVTPEMARTLAAALPGDGT